MPAGARGPVPKRSDQRRRRNKTEIAYSRGTRAGNNAEIPGPDPDWHPLALNYYKAFVLSGQTQYWEPSDWAHLVDILDDVSNYKYRTQRSANMRASLDGALSRLLVAEGDRRRMRIELNNGEQTDDDEDAAVVALNEHVRKLSG